jgi:hypothetical protein
MLQCGNTDSGTAPTQQQPPGGRVSRWITLAPAPDLGFNLNKIRYLFVAAFKFLRTNGRL